MLHEGELNPNLIKQIDRELSAYEHARRAPREERSRFLSGIAIIEPPLPVVVFENGDYLISNSPFNMHANLWDEYNEQQSRRRLEIALSLVSGQAFKLKANPTSFVRMDNGINTAAFDLTSSVMKLREAGYVVLAPDYSRLRLT